MLHPGSLGHTEAHNAMLLRIVQHVQDLGVAARTAIRHIDMAKAQSAGVVISAPARLRWPQPDP
jgi:hypothetical protein